MLIEIGEKLHVVYRAKYENSTRLHYVGEVIQIEGEVCRLEGYAFVFDIKQDSFLRKANKRTAFIHLGDSGYIVNLIPKATELEKIKYQYISSVGLLATDGAAFKLDISEFSFKT